MLTRPQDEVVAAVRCLDIGADVVVLGEAAVFFYLGDTRVSRYFEGRAKFGFEERMPRRTDLSGGTLIFVLFFFGPFGAFGTLLGAGGSGVRCSLLVFQGGG